MYKFLCGFIAVLLVFCPAGVPIYARETGNVCTELGNLTESLVTSGKAKGAVLSIVQDGKIQLCTGYGFADKYHNIAADGEKTAFRIGSVSKTFVAVAAQILHQEGHLDMTRDISVYLEPDFPTLSYPVTMQQLLTHTAGFEDIVTGIAVANISDTEPLSESVRKYLPAQVFKSGEVVSYSNYGIALAAYVMERITGEDFSQYCRDRIFLPLDMQRTTFAYMHDIVLVSKPYLPDGTETMEPTMNLYPEGSAVSTAEDMAKYMQWLLDVKDIRVLSPKSKEALFSRQFSMAEELQGVGYTWNRKSHNHSLYYDKKGETLHFYTRIALYPEVQSGIFLSFNTYIPEHEINALMEKASDLLYGETMQPGKDSGKATLNINGCYVNNWSSFRTPEKILRYLVPGKMLEIQGSLKDGFYINDERLVLSGEDLYTSSMGVLKFFERDGKIMIATESAISFSKVPSWQRGSIQALPALFFVLMTLAIFLRKLFLPAVKRKKEYRGFFLTCSLVQFLSFCTLCLLMVHGITSFSLLFLTTPIKLCGWLILATYVMGIGYTCYCKAKEHPLGPFPVAWIAAGILFCASMAWFHIL